MEVNNRWLAKLGYRREDVFGKWFGDLLPLAQQRRFAEDFPRFLREGRLDGVEFDLRKADGATLSASFDCTVARSEQGGVWRTHCVFQDITQRRQAEREREMLAQAIRQTAEAICLTDMKGDATYVNPAFLSLTGYDEDEVLGAPVGALLQIERMPQDQREELRSTLRQGRSWRGETVSRRKDGSFYDSLLTVSPVKDAEGRITHFVGTHKDISRERDLERQVRQTHKMEAVGNLASGIAHDFNNILGAIVGYAELSLGEQEQLPQPVQDNLRQILAASDRARDLVRQILSFSRQDEHERGPVDLALVVNEAARLMRATLPSTVDFFHEVDQGAAPVWADHTQMHQVIINLCTNAAQAMRAQGGRLGLKLAKEDLGPGEAARFADLEPGPYVHLAVSDTGPGMDSATLERIFEPFFSTKAKGEGTGMGLTVVHGIVKASGGVVVADSQPGQGAVFHVYLPRLDEAAMANQPAEETEPPRGAERILFVDDEPTLAEVARLMLTDLGYEVVSRTNPLEALELLRQDPQAFDLLITDQTMPGLTGDQLISEAMALRGDLPVILCSGFYERDTSSHALALGARAFLRKPVVKRDLALVVRRVLDEAGGAGAAEKAAAQGGGQGGSYV